MGEEGGGGSERGREGEGRGRWRAHRGREVGGREGPQREGGRWEGGREGGPTEGGRGGSHCGQIHSITQIELTNTMFLNIIIDVIHPFLFRVLGWT